MAFSEVAGQRSYNSDEVDAFLEHVEAALLGQTGRTLTPDQVRSTVFSKPPLGRRGYAAADVDEFLDRLEIELARRAGQQPGQGRAQDQRIGSRRGLAIDGLGSGLSYVFYEMFSPTRSDHNRPDWVLPAWGAICIVIGVVTGTTNHGWHLLWVGIAVLTAAAILSGFGSIWAWVRRPRDDGKSTPGRHGAL